MKIQNQLWWILPVFVMALVTPFTSAWDQSIADYYYTLDVEEDPLYRRIYTYGIIPAQLLGILSFLALILSYCLPSYKTWRKPALVLVLSMMVGAGLIVHTALKDQWGRPRPKQILDFGGGQAFRPYYKPNFFNQPEPSRSFPCGHCTMGYYFFALAFIFWRENKNNWAWFMYAAALLWGSILGIARMAQGGHFLSDVLISGLIMWLTAGLFTRLIYGPEQQE